MRCLRITAEKKANLIEKMQKARSMERLTVVHFDMGEKPYTERQQTNW
jgi:hypothetical protein